MSWNIQDLFRRYAGEILRNLRRRGFSHENAADLTQDAFVRLLSTTKPAGDGHNPRAYLHAVSRNLAVDFVRRERRSQRVHLSEEAFNALADSSPDAETIVYDRQRLAIVESALAELPPDTRRAFELYRMGDMTLAQVSEVMGCSIARTWHHVRDAFTHIRLRLKDDAPAEKTRRP